MKNRILSVFCAIAMLATMMSAFVVTASAADVPAITMTVLKQATATEPAEIQVGYEGLPEGSIIKGIEIVIPIDETVFTFVEGSATGGLKYVARDKAVKRAWAATQEEDYLTKTEDTIGTFKLALAEGVKGGSTYVLKASEDTQFTLATGDVKMTGSVELSTGEKEIPNPPVDPEIPTTPYVYTKVLAQPEDAGKEVEIEVSYANLPESSVIKGIEIVIPIDETKYTFVEGSATGGLKYVARDKAVKRAWAATQEEDYLTKTEDTIGTFKIKLADTVEWGETITIASSSDTQFTLATGDVKMTAVPGTIVVGSGAVKGLTVTADKTALTLEPGASDVVTLTIANAEGTPTVTAKSDNTDVTATVSGTKVTVKAGAKAKDGTAKVTVTVKDDDNCEAAIEIAVTVKAKAAEKPAVKPEAKPETKKIAGVDVKFFNATLAPAAGVTAEQIDALIKDTETYQVIFDAKTAKGYSAGYAVVAGLSAAKVKAAIADGTTPILETSINIGGADNVTITLLDSKGNTIVLPE